MTDPDDASAALHERVARAAASETAEDLYEHAPCGFLSALADGTIVKANQTFLTWTGYERDDLVGRRRFQDLLTAGGRIYHETHYAPLLRMQGAVREIALEIVAADGERLPVLVNSTLRPDTAGSPPLIRTTVFDATNRRRYEAELLRARRQAEESEARARRLAATLQSSLIPPAPPVVPGLDVAAAYRPAGDGTQVGGDFYDVFEIGAGDWGVVLGDVCGKGAEAAGVTALVRHTTRAAAMRTKRPRRVLATVNDALLRQGVERFCTAVYARVHQPTGRPWRITLASGGHPLPVRVAATGRVAELGLSGGLLGVMPAPPLHDAAVDLQPGDVVVLYSDGVPDARRGSEFFGEDALRACITVNRDEKAAAIAAAVVDEVMTFQSGLARDDIALLVLKVPPAD